MRVYANNRKERNVREKGREKTLNHKTWTVGVRVTKMS